MLCGLYELDITPSLELNLPGYFLIRCAAGIRDNLYARALACENNKGDSFILVALDAIAIEPHVSARVRNRVQELTGVPGMNVMVSATHTHTGGPVASDIPEMCDSDYVEWMADRAADAAVLAWKNRKPAKIGNGSAYEDNIAHIRRYFMKDGTCRSNPGFHPDLIDRPAGEIDPQVGIIKIEDMDGKLIGVVTNYACHLDTVGGYRFCADYPGELHRVLKAVYGKDLISIFLTGACGNINHYDYINKDHDYYWDKEHPHHIRMGRMLAGDVIRALADIETHETEDLAVENATFTGYVRTPSAEEVAQAEAILTAKPFVVYKSHEGERFPWWEESYSGGHFARSLLSVHNDPNKVLQVPVQAARIGDAAIVGVPCELFVEFGKDIKARSGFENVLISTLTNDHYGYIAIREAFDQGGYETRISGDTKMAAETGYDMADTAVELLKKMK